MLWTLKALVTYFALWLCKSRFSIVIVHQHSFVRPGNYGLTHLVEQLCTIYMYHCLQIQYFSISEVFIIVDPCEIRNIDLLSYEKKLLKLELNQNINLYLYMSSLRNSYLVMVSN